MIFRLFVFGLAARLLVPPYCSAGEVRIVSAHIRPDAEAEVFAFKELSKPSRADAATEGKFTLVDGELDPNSGGLARLHDGKLPHEADQPGANCFFRAGTDGGRILVDLGKAIEIGQVNSFSWHLATRGPQVYKLFAADGTAGNFKSEPKRPLNPVDCGWRLLAAVDTRPGAGDPGGQYGVSIRDSGESLGNFRYLLFDISQTENADLFGNTFYSEIDVIDARASKPQGADAASSSSGIGEELVEVDGYQIRIDTSDTPELTTWAHGQVAPMARQWYPKLAKLLPSEHFDPPKKVSIVFDPQMRGVAATSGARVRCAAGWISQNLEGEALGAIFHELVHVIQQYGRDPQPESGAIRPPGWLVEGIADYLRWFKFEATSKGAEITRNNLSRARFDGSYRITANFLNWASGAYDPELVPQLNAAARQGSYRLALWQERTGHTLEDLGAAWKAAMEKKVAEQGVAVEKP